MPHFDDRFAAEFETLLRWRRDVRHFAPTPIAEADMQDLLTLASLAPSVGHSQPWRWVRLRSPGLREELAAHVDAENARAAQRYEGQERETLYRSLKLHGIAEAPEVLAVFCDEETQTGHGLGVGTMPEMRRYSCVAAIQTLWLAACLRGIGLGWVSILDPQVVRRMLDVPRHWSLIAVLCLGYPAQPSDTPELERRGWQGREPLTDRILER